MLANPFAKKSGNQAIAALLVEQARAQLQGERERFGALQTQATGLLALVGLMVSIGGAFLAGFVSREYEWSVCILGRTFSFALAVSIVLALLAFGFLMSSGTKAVGVLQQVPDPESEELMAVVDTQFPALVEGETAASTQVLLSFLTEQLRRTQETNARVSGNLRQVPRGLAGAVLSGLVLVVILLAGTTANNHQTYSVKGLGKGTVTVERAR